MGLIDRIRGALRGRRTDADGTATRDEARPQHDDRPGAKEASASAAATTPEQAPATAPAAERHPTTTVQPGETLADVAARHGVDADAIARLNNIEEPDLVFAGQVFKVPRG